MIKLQAPTQIMNKDEVLTVTREGVTTYVDGRAVHASSSTFQLVTNVQPVNGRDLLLLPEGDRFKEQYYLYSEKKQGPLQVNDIVVRNAVNFAVQSVEDWGTFNRARMMRIDVGNIRTP